jgi:CubicO group peptidase (beta-lactamase class C family)
MLVTIGPMVDHQDLGEPMMRNRLRPALCRTLTSFVLAISQFPGPVVAAAWDYLPTEVERGMEMWQVPGMAVAVVDSDNVEFQQGFGSTAIKEGNPVDAHTMFAIASTTKAMVVTGILMLADEEKLALDDLIVAHIPELHFANPSLDKELTLRDMLAHRTGLPSTDYWAFLQVMELDEQIRRLRLVDAIAPARTRLIYQNTMYELAGEIIERASGKRWEEFLNERLWQPIGMGETVAERGMIPGNLSHVLPYRVVDGQLVQADWDLYEDHADAAGSVWSSLHDMSLWAQFLLRGGVTADGERLVSEKSFAQMFEPHQLASEADFYPTTKLTQPHWRSYGLGWFQQDFQGRMINFHTGSLTGLVAIIGLDRAADKAVVVLGNRDHAEMRHALLWDVMDNRETSAKRDWNEDVFALYEGVREEALAEEKEREASRLRGTKPALPLKSYAGSYSNEIIGDIDIELDGRRLIARFPSSSRHLKHWHLETFELLDEHGESMDLVSFTIDPAGAVASLTVLGNEFVRTTEQ